MAGFSDEEFVAMTDAVWRHVNLPNLVDHIAPTRTRADLVLEKGEDHRVAESSCAPDRPASRAIIQSVGRALPVGGGVAGLQVEASG